MEKTEEYDTCAHVNKASNDVRDNLRSSDTNQFVASITNKDPNSKRSEMKAKSESKLIIPMKAAENSNIEDTMEATPINHEQKRECR